MILELDDTIIRQTGLSPNELRLELALQLYQDQKISLGQGGALSGLGVIYFQRELGKRQITLHYDQHDLADDIDTLKRHGQL